MKAVFGFDTARSGGAPREVPRLAVVRGFRPTACWAPSRMGGRMGRLKRHCLRAGATIPVAFAATAYAQQSVNGVRFSSFPPGYQMDTGKTASYDETPPRFIARGRRSR